MITFHLEDKSPLGQDKIAAIAKAISDTVAVKKELIINKPIEYYKELILEVNHHINSTEGHFFERSWYYIFN